MIIDWGGSYQGVGFDSAWTYETYVTSSFQFYSYTMDGGGIAGGIADMFKSALVTMDGGCISGGGAVMTRAANIDATGGGVSGGDANVLGTLGRSGGGGSTVVSRSVSLRRR